MKLRAYFVVGVALSSCLAFGAVPRRHSRPRKPLDTSGWSFGQVVVPPVNSLGWPIQPPALDWQGSALRDIFVDPRRPLPVPLPGAIASGLANLPTVTTSHSQTNDSSAHSLADSRSAQVRFWDAVAGAFPTIVARVMLPHHQGWVCWSTGQQQSIGQTISFTVQPNRRSYTPGRRQIRGEGGPIRVDFTLVALLDGYVVVTLNSFGNTYLLPSERVLWTIPWSWFSYLSPQEADYSRAPAPSVASQLQSILGASSASVQQAPAVSSPVQPSSALGAVAGRFMNFSAGASSSQASPEPQVPTTPPTGARFDAMLHTSGSVDANSLDGSARSQQDSPPSRTAVNSDSLPN